MSENQHSIENETIVSKTEDAVVLSFTAPASCDFYDGHFPEFKLLPAVGQFEIVTRFSKKYSGPRRGTGPTRLSVLFLLQKDLSFLLLLFLTHALFLTCSITEQNRMLPLFCTKMETAKKNFLLEHFLFFLRSLSSNVAIFSRHYYSHIQSRKAS